MDAEWYHFEGQSRHFAAYAIMEPHAASDHPRAAAAVSGLD